MTRGGPATTGISGASAIARARGEFIPFAHSPEGIFSFMIRTPAAMLFVRVQYVNLLHVPAATLAKQHTDLIAELRARSGPAPAELWPYNKHGSYRYFRISTSGLVELDACGNPAIPEQPVQPGQGIEELSGQRPDPKECGP